MGFWGKVGDVPAESNKNEIVIDLQKQLSKLEYADIDYLYTLLLEKQYRGREIERATTVLLKIRFIRNQLKESTDESTKIEDD